MSSIIITAHTELQKSYTYARTEPTGKNFADNFKPMLTPKEMLALGVFGGAYFLEIPTEFPRSWWNGAKISSDGQQHKELNYFNVLASQSQSVWKERGWIHKDDPHGWFEWYCRYYVGRRHNDDARQIKRWNMMRRHISQIVNNCRSHELTCRPRQRQALLHWAYDTRRL